MKRLLFLLSCLLAGLPAFAQIGYQLGDEVPGFVLRNVDGKLLDPQQQYPAAKGFIVIFSCNSCAYARMYTQRMIALHQTFATAGYPLIAINPNNPEISPEDAFEEMQSMAQTEHLPFPYLFDEQQSVVRAFGATRTPQAFVLHKSAEGSLRLVYIGAIDDGPRSEQEVQNDYLAQAIRDLLQGRTVQQAYTRATGCGIKWLQ